jgi:hypothetical protein
LSYWFAYRVSASSSGGNPGAAVLEGPFETNNAAKSEKESIRGWDMEKTAIFTAETKGAAQKQLDLETWMV